MGKKEKESRQKTRRKNLKKIILGTVAATGVISVALLAPNVIGAMGKLGLLPHGRQKESICTARNRLVRQGLLVHEGHKLVLTQKGEKMLRMMEASNFVIQKPRRWDHKWRILIFDIPEKKRIIRDKIRRTLSTIGFIQLQQSVWLYPYDCEDVVNLLKADLRVGKDLLYLIVDSLEYDERFRRRFGLSLT